MVTLLITSLLPPLLLVFLVSFILLVLLHLNTCFLLQLLQAQRICHQCLIRCLFLLFYSKQRIFANLGSNITSGIRILYSNEILVRSANLGDRLETIIAMSLVVCAPSRSHQQSISCPLSSFQADNPLGHSDFDRCLWQESHTSTPVSLSVFDPFVPLAIVEAPAAGVPLPSLYAADRVSSSLPARRNIHR